MSSIWRGACALSLAAAFAGGAAAQTAEPGSVGRVAFATDSSSGSEAAPGDVELVSCESGDCYGGDCYGGCDPYGDCGCDSCPPMGCDVGMGDGVCRRSRFFVGGEYLSVRANFSEATAFRVNDVGNNSETFEQFDFDYGDSYRVFAGYQLCDCDAEIRFTYTNFDSSGGFGPIVDDGDPNTTLSAPLIDVPPDGGFASVQVDNYDLGFAKTIPLGSPLCGCDPCGDPCGCDPCGCGAWCPAWDVQWSGGIRVANVDSELGYFADGGSPTVADRIAASRVSFDGVGLRTGLLGRRYLGRTGFASVFVRGDISLLLGDVDVVAESIEDPVLGGGATFPTTTLSSTEVIPVTEIEAGGSLYLTPRVTFTGGYLLSAWHDLGHRFEYDFGASGTQILSADDANMLMFDGWFLRLEAFF